MGFSKIQRNHYQKKIHKSLLEFFPDSVKIPSRYHTSSVFVYNKVPLFVDIPTNYDFKGSIHGVPNFVWVWTRNFSLCLFEEGLNVQKIWNISPLSTVSLCAGFYVVYHFFGLPSSATLEELEKKGRRFCDFDWNAIASNRGIEVHVEHYCFRQIPPLYLLDLSQIPILPNMPSKSLYNSSSKVLLDYYC